MTIKSPALEWNADRGLGFYTPAACDFVNRQSLQEFCIEFVTVPFCQHKCIIERENLQENEMDFVWMVLFGLMSGLAINYLSDRLPWQRSPGRPLCHHCGQEKRWQDFLLLRACSHCNRKPSWRNPLVMLLALGIAFLIPSYGFWKAAVLEYFLLVAVMDIEHRVIMHPVSALGLILGGITGWREHGWQQALLGGAIAGLIMGAAYLFGLYYARWMAHRRKLEGVEEGLGFGDVTLSLILGLILGMSVLRALMLGILAGGIFGLLYLLFFARRPALQAAIPYAPFLLLGSVIVLLR